VLDLLIDGLVMRGDVGDITLKMEAAAAHCVLCRGVGSASETATQVKRVIFEAGRLRVVRLEEPLTRMECQVTWPSSRVSKVVDIWTKYIHSGQKLLNCNGRLQQ